MKSKSAKLVLTKLFFGIVLLFALAMAFLNFTHLLSMARHISTAEQMAKRDMSERDRESLMQDYQKVSANGVILVGNFKKANSRAFYLSLALAVCSLVGLLAFRNSKKGKPAQQPDQADS